MTDLTQEDMIVLLNGHVRAAGSQKAAARLLGISTQYLNDVLRLRRAVSASLAATLGYDRIVRFRPKGGDNA